MRNCKYHMLLNMSSNLQSREILGNVVGLWQSSRPKVSFREDSEYFWFHSLVFLGSFQKTGKTLWDHGDSISLEKLWTSNAKTEQWLMQDVFFCIVKLVMNKQLFYSLSWNKHLSKIKSHSLIPLKRNSPFMRYLLIGYQSAKWSENFLNWH